MNGDIEQTYSPPTGFFGRLIELLFKSSDPEREKKRLLAEIARNLKKLKTKRYNPKSDLAEHGIARLFFEFYKTLGPAQLILDHADTSNILRIILIEGSLNMEELTHKEKFSEESIRERVTQIDHKKLVDELTDGLKVFYSFFNSTRINEINSNYKSLSSILNLIRFDYYFLLKKFDSKLQEAVFTYKPHFESINAQYIKDELKDFLEIIPTVDISINWNSIMDVIKEYRGVDALSRDSWKKLLQLIRELKKTKELEMIVQLIDKDPFYRPEPKVKRENIVESYLAKLKIQTEMAVQKIVQEGRKKKIDDLAGQVFGTASVSRLRNYTEKANITFSKKMLGGYIYINPLNYLKAFLLDYVKKDIRQMIDMLLIPGKWTDNVTSNALSESFHQLLKISDEILSFDNTLGEDGELWRKVQNAVHKADRDKKAMNQLREIIKTINDQAKDMIMRAGQQCISLGNVLKLVLEDYGKKHPALIINWKELEAHSEQNMKKMLVSIYKQLYYFVHLLKICT